MADLETLISRLESTSAGVRRLAVLDLLRLAPAQPEATEALLRHLPRETDEKASLAIIRRLELVSAPGAQEVLWALYQDRSTPVRIALAAIIAHDRLLRAGSSDPLQSPRGSHSDDADPQ